MDESKKEILELIEKRVSEGWDKKTLSGQIVWITPPKDDPKINWCAVWKSIVDDDTGLVYRYPHWITED